VTGDDLDDLGDLLAPRYCPDCGEVTARWFDGLGLRCVVCYPPPGM